MPAVIYKYSISHTQRTPVALFEEDEVVERAVEDLSRKAESLSQGGLSAVVESGVGAGVKVGAGVEVQSTGMAGIHDMVGEGVSGEGSRERLGIMDLPMEIQGKIFERVSRRFPYI